MKSRRHSRKRTASAVLCALLTLSLHYWAGCGVNAPALRLPPGVQRIDLHPGDPLFQSLVGTALEGAIGLEIDTVHGAFRVIHADKNRLAWGKIAQADGHWRIETFSFLVNGQGANLFFNAPSFQVNSITTTQGDRWKPSMPIAARGNGFAADLPKPSTAADRVFTSSADYRAAFEAANPELMAADGGKIDAAFLAPLFFFIAMTWLLCAAGAIPLCPSFQSIFGFLALLLALLGGQPPAGSDTPPADDGSPAANTPPVALDDTFTIFRGQSAAGNVLNDNGNGADGDLDNDPLAVSLVTGPANGSLTLNNDGAFSYTPSSGFVGADSFVYQIDDGRGGTATATATINVLNNPPDARDDAFEGTVKSDITGDLFADNGDGADTDPDADPITVTEVNGNAAAVGTPFTLPSGALVTVLADGTFTYDDNGAFDDDGLNSGDVVLDTFTYTISDGFGGTDTATVTLNVTWFPTD